MLVLGKGLMLHFCLFQLSSCLDLERALLSRGILEFCKLTWAANLQEEGYVTADVADKKSLHQLKLSGTKFRQLLRAGEEIPDWFAFKSVVAVLRDASASNGSG